MKTFALTQIGLKRVSLIGMLLDLIHLALQPHFPDLSPHYRLYRSMWARLFMLSEYFCLMMAFIVGLSNIVKAASTRNPRDANLPGLILFMIFFVLWSWVYR